MARCKCLEHDIEEARHLGENDTRPLGLRIEHLLMEHSADEVEAELDGLDPEFMERVRLVERLAAYDRGLPEPSWVGEGHAAAFLI